MLKATGISKSHHTPQGPLTLFTELNFTLNPAESVALMGESGSGKSTLLHILAGLEPADAGNILLHEHNLTSLNDRQRAHIRRDYFGVIFQQLNLIPSLSVYDNLVFQARLAQRLEHHWLDHLIAELGLQQLLSRYPSQLSGGQQQRVAIGRALAAKTPYILADEPTGSLDEINAEQVMSLLLALVKETGTSLFMVTHSQALAQRLDRSLTLRQGQLV